MRADINSSSRDYTCTLGLDWPVLSNSNKWLHFVCLPSDIDRIPLSLHPNGTVGTWKIVDILAATPFGRSPSEWWNAFQSSSFLSPYP